MKKRSGQTINENIKDSTSNSMAKPNDKIICKSEFREELQMKNIKHIRADLLTSCNYSACPGSLNSLNFEQQPGIFVQLCQAD